MSLRRRVPRAAAALTLLTSVLTGASLALSATRADAVSVSTEAELRAALADLAETEITLLGDVTVTCSPGQLLRPPGASDLVLDGAGFTITQTCAGSRVLETQSALELRDVTITGGTETASTVGGGVFSNAPLTLDGVTVTGNTAGPSGAVGGNGGGVFSNGATVIRDSVLSNNTAAGGTGIFGALGGALSGNGGFTVIDSTLSGNTAGGAETSGGGGGAVFGNGAFTFVRSTISGNVAEAGSTSGGGGGGATSTNGAITIISSTVTGNVAEGSGSINGGLATGDELTIVNSTITANSSEAGGANVDGSTNADEPVHIVNSVIAEPLGGAPNCGNDNPAANTSGGYSWADDESCALDDATDTEDPGGDPMLGVLASNGGPTATRLPADGSPLLDAIPAAACEAGEAADTDTDQRGVVRPQAGACDIGAVEVAAPAPEDPGGPGTGSDTETPPAVPVSAAPRFTG